MWVRTPVMSVKVGLWISSCVLWFSLRNASGQTAADLAHAKGFLDCFSFISKTKKHLLQLGGVHKGNSAPCGQALHSRKRLQTAEDTGHMKKARAAESKTFLLHFM